MNYWMFLSNEYVNRNTMNIFKLFAMLACPFKILANIPLCIYYWFLDVLFYFVWLIIWSIIYVFVYWPIKIEFYVFCFSFGKIIDFCPTISMNDLCPTKIQFFNGIENMNMIFSSKPFLLRSKDDIKKCYCMPPIKMLFGPLTSVKTLEDAVASSANNADKGSSMSLFVSFGILTLLYVLSLSYYSDADYMYDDVHAGSTFDNIAQIPPQEGVV
jgi:hypothetical protein